MRGQYMVRARRPSRATARRTRAARAASPPSARGGHAAAGARRRPPSCGVGWQARGHAPQGAAPPRPSRTHHAGSATHRAAGASAAACPPTGASRAKSRQTPPRQRSGSGPESPPVRRPPRASRSRAPRSPRPA
eukprot:scaffold243938_cov30-Tisochrysis_lutea.AAC.4